MKKVLWMLFAAMAMACGDGSNRAEDREAASEEVDVGSGDEISPQLDLDSTETRFEVDSISSTQEAEKESDPDDESF